MMRQEESQENWGVMDRSPSLKSLAEAPCQLRIKNINTTRNICLRLSSFPGVNFHFFRNHSRNHCTVKGHAVNPLFNPSGSWICLIWWWSHPIHASSNSLVWLFRKKEKRGKHFSATFWNNPNSPRWYMWLMLGHLGLSLEKYLPTLWWLLSLSVSPLNPCA